MGGRGLCAAALGADPRRRRAGRHPWPPARLRHRHPHLRHRLGLLRPGDEPGQPHPQPGAAGHRRRADGAGQPRAAGGEFPARAARQGDRALVGRHRGHGRRRAGAGRLARPCLLLALGLSHQSAAGGIGARHPRRARAGEPGEPRRRTRYSGRGAGDAGAGRRHLRPHRGRAAQLSRSHLRPADRPGFPGPGALPLCGIPQRSADDSPGAVPPAASSPGSRPIPSCSGRGFRAPSSSCPSV